MDYKNCQHILQNLEQRIPINKDENKSNLLNQGLFYIEHENDNNVILYYIDYKIINKRFQPIFISDKRDQRYLNMSYGNLNNSKQILTKFKLSTFKGEVYPPEHTNNKYWTVLSELLKYPINLVPIKDKTTGKPRICPRTIVEIMNDNNENIFDKRGRKKCREIELLKIKITYLNNELDKFHIIGFDNKYNICKSVFEINEQIKKKYKLYRLTHS